MAPTLDDYIDESETYDADDAAEIPNDLRAEIDTNIDDAHSS
ncbi:hypothetical protein [Halohasta litorea]|uniref:Uncharacterized protein n=1 Tax=Halohasta litorea TaxID=869891 RepID=A0ABD6D576_9EURY|nr:hypothetical protein [Halohasta litorea]MEA1930024.1 hypothetical protein [Euryarchaeota archaeon]